MRVTEASHAFSRIFTIGVTRVVRSTTANADETTHFRGKARLWLWVLCTQQLAFIMVHASRGKKAAEQLLGGFAGILASDRHVA